MEACSNSNVANKYWFRPTFLNLGEILEIIVRSQGTPA
jgi:hypothetical protein